MVSICLCVMPFFLPWPSQYRVEAAMKIRFGRGMRVLISWFSPRSDRAPYPTMVARLGMTARCTWWVSPFTNLMNAC